MLFDDDDLPLKGKRSGGRAKKKKLEDDNDGKGDEKGSLEWHRAGKISGKLFEDDDDDIHDDFDDYYKQQQLQQPPQKPRIPSSPQQPIRLTPRRRTLPLRHRLRQTLRLKH